MARGWSGRGVRGAPNAGQTGAASALAVGPDYVYGADERLRAGDQGAAMLESAQRLSVAGLREAWARFLEDRLRAANSLALRHVAAAFSLPSLVERCSHVLCQACTEVARHADFLQLASDEVAALWADPGLGVAREEAAFEVTRRWVRHDAPGRARAAAAPGGARAPAPAGPRLFPAEGEG